MRPAIDFRSGMDESWNRVATFVPKFLAFLVILIIGYFIAKAVEKLLDKVLQRVGFDRLVERGGIKTALAKSKYDAASILGRLVFYAIMLFVLSTAFGVFGTNPVSVYLTAVIAYLPKVFVAILIIVVTAAIAAAVKTLIQSTLGGLSYGKAVSNAASIFIIALGVIAALNQLSIAANVVNAVLYAALATIAGILIIAVGGGGIKAMSNRWDATMTKYDEEKPKIAQAVATANPVADVKKAAGNAVPSADPGSKRM